MKTALITGVTGQDGAYLSKLLLSEGYKVIGVTRNHNNDVYKLDYLKITDLITIVECDLLDFSSILKVMTLYNPDEVYNLAAQSSVGLSFSQPIGTINFNLMSVINLLEAIKIINPRIKFYQASSSEMFGRVEDLPINEKSAFHPQSPYAVSKAAAHWAAINYREAYNLFICCGILFNHESYLRNENFIIKKLIREAVLIKKGQKQILKVGNLNIKRDFGYAPKYVEAMYLMMQMGIPDDYIICSGKSVKLQDIAIYIFNKLNIPIKNIIVDQNLYRPSEIFDIFGDNTKAKQVLSWQYESDIFEILDLMISEELSNT